MATITWSLLGAVVTATMFIAWAVAAAYDRFH